MKDKQDIAAEAYQVIGVLADRGSLFDNKDVIRALDYFSNIANGYEEENSILPFAINNENQD